MHVNYILSLKSDLMMQSLWWWVGSAVVARQCEMTTLAGKVALVTGGSRGLGAAIVGSAKGVQDSKSERRSSVGRKSKTERIVR
ncbi:hypothetical protein [Nostoc sp. CCY 9925]|uniref:hypothetical protein n=1 Tax=Nostoc sp. CCY 9925 TaxID=3103865 RepID=UPI0039C69494